MAIGPLGADFSPCFRKPASRRPTACSVNSTRQQIENSPAIESHKPVSLQYQAYWDGGETWGMGGFPRSAAASYAE